MRCNINRALSTAVRSMHSSWWIKLFVSYCIVSGVTRVGDTRGGNWGCHPSIFFLKTWRPFLLIIAVTITIAIYCFDTQGGDTPWRGCHPLQGGVSPFLPVRPRCFSTILCKFAHKFFFLRVTPLCIVTFYALIRHCLTKANYDATDRV